MVLANGTITDISYERNPELAVALRGSGDQFGIATRFTAEAHPMGQASLSALSYLVLISNRFRSGEA
jgi:hypothetical protein